MWTEPRRRTLSTIALFWLAAGIVWLGAALRAAPLTANRFHADEALYATLARLIVSGRDPLLSETSLLVDKPPLAYYSLAASVGLLGASELAFRLPSLLASILGLAMTFRLARQFWRRSDVALMSIALVAFSPFGIQFAPTVFSDSLMALFLMASLSAVSSRRWGWGGACLGLAVAVKSNALFTAPLVSLVAVICFLMSPLQEQRAHWLPFPIALGSILAVVALWDAFRQPAPSFWLAAAAANNPGRLARSAEALSRALGWLSWLRHFTANRVADVVLTSVALAAPALDFVHHAGRRAAAMTIALAAYMIAYLAFHWLVAFPMLDRYLLPIVPLVALLASRGVALASDWTSYAAQSVLSRAITFQPQLWITGTIAIIIMALLIAPANAASRSAYPVGGDHGANDGIDKVAAWLDDQPWGTVLYSRKLDWVARFYLFDAFVYPVYLDTPNQFEDDLEAFGASGPPRYLLLSATEPALAFQSAAHFAGYRLTPVLAPEGRTGSPTMTLYRIEKSP